MPQSIVNVGWDHTNEQWRNPIYMKLDKNFHAVEQVDSSLAAYKIHPF
jgi:hypothetical protein